MGLIDPSKPVPKKKDETLQQEIKLKKDTIKANTPTITYLQSAKGTFLILPTTTDFSNKNTNSTNNQSSTSTSTSSSVSVSQFLFNRNESYFNNFFQ